jgi:hypothetical protein
MPRAHAGHSRPLLTTLVSNSVRSEIRTDFRSPDETNNQPYPSSRTCEQVEQ